MTPTVTPTTLPAPRWIRVCAYVAACTPLPSALWRVLLVTGHPAGYTAQGYRDRDAASLAGGTAMIALSALTLLASLLTLGLVRRWGEVVPRWVPVIGARAVPPRTATVTAALGAAIAILLWTQFVFWWSLPHDDMTERGALVIGLLYLPMVTWGPLLLVVTISYWKRNRTR